MNTAAGTQDWSMQIWQFLTLEIWMQTFVDETNYKNVAPNKRHAL